MGCDPGGPVDDGGRRVGRVSPLNPEQTEYGDRYHALAHIITPDGVSSVPHNASGELIVAMVQAAAARWGYPLKVDLP